MKVRALPTWRKPVGEGAKRTRGFSCETALEISDIRGRNGDNKRRRLGKTAHYPEFDVTDGQDWSSRLSAISILRANLIVDNKSKLRHVLKSYCVYGFPVKTFIYCFPPKLSGCVRPGVSSPAL